MGTRSNIGLIEENNSVEMVYCQFDGYPEHNGKVLLENYSDTKRVRELLSFGDMSSLGKNIGTKHNFNSFPLDECNFYGRDRDEKNVGSKKRLTLKGAMERKEQYLYLWDIKTETWFWASGESLLPLTASDCVKKKL